MKKIILLLAVLSIFSCASKKKKDDSGLKAINSKESLSLLKETNGLPAPESVVRDAEKNVLYVSCQAGELPGDGSIAKSPLGFSISGEMNHSLKFLSLSSL